MWDLRTIAKRRTPIALFDYRDGAAEAELSLARARKGFEDVEFQSAILRKSVQGADRVGGYRTLGVLPGGDRAHWFHSDDASRSKDQGAHVAAKWGSPSLSPPWGLALLNM